MLLAGAGGGFDVYATLPLAFALREAGSTVHFANLSFTFLPSTDATAVAPCLFEVSATTSGPHNYFPERTLARWLERRGLVGTVYALTRTGVRPARDAYRALIDRLGIDAVVLVDGGTDLLMRGDEAGLGTPHEDMTSLAAFDGIEGVPRFAACVGFGIDTFHGVCHAHFLEAVAGLEREGGYLGAFSVSRHTPEGAAFLDAVDDAIAQTPTRPSIVNGSIGAALRGAFGNEQFTHRTAGSDLFINPLMGIYFTFDLPAVARRSLYLDRLRDTETARQVDGIIADFLGEVAPRCWKAMPV